MYSFYERMAFLNEKPNPKVKEINFTFNDSGVYTHKPKISVSLHPDVIYLGDGKFCGTFEIINQ